jgi:hypothetical protein
VLAVLAVGIVLGGTPAPASAATPCGKKVAQDWSDNGRIDGLYELHCYEEGIDALPQEILDYTNAEDVIRQAYLSVGGGNRPPPPSDPPDDTGDQPPPEVLPTVDTSATTDVPVPVFVLSALALVLLGAGALGYASRRRSAGHDEPPPP